MKMLLVGLITFMFCSCTSTPTSKKPLRAIEITAKEMRLEVSLNGRLLLKDTYPTLIEESTGRVMSVAKHKITYDNKGRISKIGEFNFAYDQSNALLKQVNDLLISHSNQLSYIYTPSTDPRLRMLNK